MQIPSPSENTAWHHESAENVLASLGSSSTGLTSAEAARRLAAGGRNVLTEAAPVSAWRIFSRQFKSLVIWILIAAGIVSGVLGDAVDAIAIFVVVALNATIGFYQELNARKSISALKTMTAPRAKVKRDGKVVSIPAAEIVTGDVLVMEAGDSVAADSRLLKSASLKCVESALTGEAEAVMKHAATLNPGDVALGDRKNMVFMGTSVASGTGRAVVVSTAMKTELGRIAGLMEVSKADESTPLEKKLESFGRVLVWGALGIVALLFGLGLLRGTAPLELLMTSVSLAVAAVPEGLPAIVTVALALGVSRMSRRRALVRRLAAVETLGSTTVICTDKTGTLTMGEMTVRALYIPDLIYEVTGEGYEPEGEVRCDGELIDTAPLRELSTIIVGCNNAHLIEEGGTWKVIGDPTEGALLAAGRKAGVVREELERKMPKHHEIPFDSDRKRSTVVRTLPDGTLRALVNGAPGILLDRCNRISTPDGIRPITAGDREQVLARTDTMAAQALRVLGSAFRDLETTEEITAEEVERELVFVGLSGMYDPPRQEAKVAVAECHAAGIRVVLITGDHPFTATAIAREIGITTGDEAAVSGIELDKMSDDDLRSRVAKIDVYARVTAAHKLRIIHAWRANDAVVAMTGDGVNDAPAIQGADIGIAMGMTGTEVTKQAADMIITDDNFSTIVAAVEEGRGIYDNIRKTLQYLLAGSTAELLVMAVCVIIGLPSPLLPIHLLWINLITDGLPALCLATDRIDAGVMKRPPRHRLENIANRPFLMTMLFTGLITAAITFAVYLYVLKTQDPATARSYAFTVLVFAELLRAFGARSEFTPVWRIPLHTNLNLVIVIAVSFGLQILSLNNAVFGRFLNTQPIPLTHCLLLILIATVPLIILEAAKMTRTTSSSR
jgi:Ca2+-transporting ATPase